MYISDAGFARLINGAIAAPLGDTIWGTLVQLYGGTDVLILGLGAYDLATRGRLHPAYMAGVGWAIALQSTAYAGLTSPTWKAVSLHLIGH